MGDGADMALDDMMDYEDERERYHLGEMSDEEAYDKGIIDELGFEPDEDR